jgi:phage gpG-like protein
MKKNIKQLPGDLRKSMNSISQYIANDAPRHVGKMAKDHFTENFDKEGFVDEDLHKWKEVKRRMPPVRKGVYGKRKILKGDTNELRNSLEYRPAKRRVSITSDVVYFSVHNEGLKAGRGKGFMMPKRQMVGDSEKLDSMIEKRLTKDINQLFKQ